MFHDRIVKAFDGLDEEAKRVEQEAYENHPDAFNPDADPASSAEWAYFEGVDYYLAVDTVRQGVINLMVAGIFHLLEQQLDFVSKYLLSDWQFRIRPGGGFSQFEEILTTRYQINIRTLRTWPLIDELRLVANTIKHGSGHSAEELKQANPNLFKDPFDPQDLLPTTMIRPLVGEGLRLTADHFTAYQHGVEQFWEELILALIPHFRRS